MFNLHHRINRILIKLSYRFGVSKLFSMPKMLALDPTNLCDLKCPLCPTGLRDKTIERGSIKLEQFKTIIDRLAKHLQSINLYSWGEPLLHKSLVDMIRHTAINHKVRTITSVHLGNLSDEQVEGLAKSGLDKLIVSVDGATQEVYEKYRVGGDIEKVFTNMSRLMGAKKRYNSKVNVVWNFLVMKQNEHQMDMARDRASKLVLKSLSALCELTSRMTSLERLKTTLKMMRNGSRKIQITILTIWNKKNKKNLSSFARGHGWKHSLTGMVMSFPVDV